MDKEEWFKKLCELAKKYNYLDLNCSDWMDYYENNYSPKEALDDDLLYGAE